MGGVGGVGWLAGWPGTEGVREGRKAACFHAECNRAEWNSCDIGIGSSCRHSMMPLAPPCRCTGRLSAQVRYDPDRVGPRQIIAVVAEAGFKGEPGAEKHVDGSALRQREKRVRAQQRWLQCCCTEGAEALGCFSALSQCTPTLHGAASGDPYQQLVAELGVMSCAAPAHACLPARPPACLPAPLPACSFGSASSCSAWSSACPSS